jgi:Ca2+-dependent lipid-binding protein
VQPAVVKQLSFGNIQEETSGSINFTLSYNVDQALLTIRLIQARDLTPRGGSGGSADPYCRLCLLPSRTHQLQSHVQRRTLCPEFGEEFILEMTPSEIAIKSLEVSLSPDVE